MRSLGGGAHAATRTRRGSASAGRGRTGSISPAPPRVRLAVDGAAAEESRRAAAAHLAARGRSRAGCRNLQGAGATTSSRGGRAASTPTGELEGGRKGGDLPELHGGGELPGPLGLRTVPAAPHCRRSPARSASSARSPILIRCAPSSICRTAFLRRPGARAFTAASPSPRWAAAAAGEEGRRWGGRPHLPPRRARGEAGPRRGELEEQQGRHGSASRPRPSSLAAPERGRGRAPLGPGRSRGEEDEGRGGYQMRGEREWNC